MTDELEKRLEALDAYTITGNGGVNLAIGLAEEAAQALRDRKAEIEGLEAERDRCHARLEIDHTYRFKAGEHIRAPIPLDERHGVPDGIECRDETIRLQDENNDRLRSRAEAAEAEIEGLRKALEEAEEILRLMEHPRHVDPLYGAEVEALGRRIGFGALMASASASWSEYATDQGHPGSEHTSGPCQATVTRTLAIVRAALSTQGEQR